MMPKWPVDGEHQKWIPGFFGKKDVLQTEDQTYISHERLAPGFATASCFSSPASVWIQKSEFQVIQTHKVGVSGLTSAVPPAVFSAQTAPVIKTN